MDKVPNKMQAAVYRGSDDLRIETIPVASIGPDELLVRVALCGVCPTDIKKIKYGTVPPPRVFGHETAGTIVRVGTRVRGFDVGERVALHHHIPCLKCHYCRHGAFAQCPQYKRTGITAGFEPAGGGFAEYVRVLPFVFEGIVKIPARNSFAEGAMLEPVNTVLKAVKRLELLRADSVLVAGQGPIGLMFTGLLSAMGMNVLASDLIAERLAMARRFGARHVFRADAADFDAQVKRATRKHGLDATIVAVPSDAVVQQSARLLRGGGKTLLFAHTRRDATSAIDLSAICVDEKDLIGSYSADVRLQKEVARWVFSRRLDVRPLITDIFPLAHAKEAISLAANPSPKALKVMVGSGN